MIAGFCYAVMFSNGTVKFGRAADLYGRLRSHTDDARKFGVGVVKLFFTYQVGGFCELEKVILSKAREELEPVHGNEYFSWKTLDSVRAIFSSCVGGYVECESIASCGKSSTVSVKINPYIISERSLRGAKSKDSISDKIVKVCASFHGGATIAVICNRIKGQARLSIELEVSRLVASGRLERDTMLHAANGTTVVKYRVT